MFRSSICVNDERIAVDHVVSITNVKQSTILREHIEVGHTIDYLNEFQFSL